MPTPPTLISTAPEPESPSDNVDPDTSYSSAANTTMSTQAEIHMCPQPMPFVYRRRALTEGQDEPLSKAVHFNPHFRQRSSPANVHIRPDTLEVIQPPSEASVDMSNKGLTQWRQDQLDNMKPGKLAGNGTVKVLSSLHGPLSLPYARNPRYVVQLEVCTTRADSSVVSTLPFPIPPPTTPTHSVFEPCPDTARIELYPVAPIRLSLHPALAFTSVTGRNISAILKRDNCPTP